MLLPSSDEVHPADLSYTLVSLLEALLGGFLLLLDPGCLRGETLIYCLSSMLKHFSMLSIDGRDLAVFGYRLLVTRPIVGERYFVKIDVIHVNIRHFKMQEGRNISEKFV